jgi:hypothetical protein
MLLKQCYSLTLLPFFSCGLVLHALPGFVCFHFLWAEFLEESFVLMAWWSYIVLFSAYHGRFLLLHLF